MAIPDCRIGKDGDGHVPAGGVLTPTKDGEFISKKLQELGGAPESYLLHDEALEQASTATPE